MPARSTIYRQKLKDTNPAKYAEIIEKKRLASQAARQAKKEKMAVATITRAMEEEREQQLEKRRQRDRLNRQKKKMEGSRVLRQSSNSTPSGRVSLSGMTPAEVREHKNKLRRESRQRRSAQKKRWERAKAREYMRDYRWSNKKRETSHPVGEPSFDLIPSIDVFSEHTSPNTPPDQALPLTLLPNQPLSPTLPPDQPLSPALLPDQPLSPALPPDQPLSPALPPHQALSPALPPHQALSPTLPPDQPSTPSTQPQTNTLTKTLYNLTTSIRSTLKKRLGNDAHKYAKIVRNLAAPRTPEKRGAIRSLGFLKSPRKQPVSSKKRPSSNASGRKDVLRKPSKAWEARQKLEQVVKVFYTRHDISRQLPHKRYATKKGAAFVMNVTISGAFRQFLSEHPEMKIGYTKFASLRPRTVRKIGQVAIETCLCIYCLNVRYKIDALNRVLARHHMEALPSEIKILDLICCQRETSQKWQDRKCIEMTCLKCKDTMKHFKERCCGIMEENVSWMHWGRSQESRKLDVFSKKGNVGELLGDLKEDLDRPTSSATFRTHLFTAFWQGAQYRDLKFSLGEGEAMMVMDFAENRKAFYNQEVKSAHFGKSQITLHPIVLYFKTLGADLARHCLMYLTDDIAHDFHLVHHFTLAALEYAKREIACLKRVYLFSDGCAAQYKGKGSFADLSLLSGLSVQRIYFGSEHGKGEADGETGVLSQSLTRAVQGGHTVIRNAGDLWEWANTNMTRRADLKQRHFFLVNPKDINRDRPERNVITVPGTRTFHQVERVSDYIIRCRKLACFCSGCKFNMPVCCINKAHVGEYETFKLKRSAPDVLDTAFVEIEAADNTAPIENAPSAGINTSIATQQEEAVTATSSRSLPQVGQYVLLTHKVGRKNVDFVALVEPMDGPGGSRDIMVSYMKNHGSYYTFPEIVDKWMLSVDAKDLVNLRVIDPPTMDKRHKFVFSF